MKKALWVALGAILALTGEATAGTPCTDEVPPIRWQKPVSQFYSVAYLDAAAMVKECGYRRNNEPDIYACTDTDTRTIYIGAAIQKDWQVCLLTHEKAHLNGWPSWHPGAIFLSATRSTN